mgnify:FL=1
MKSKLMQDEAQQYTAQVDERHASYVLVMIDEHHKVMRCNN